MHSIAPAARFAAPLSQSHIGASVAAQRARVALWLVLSDQDDVWSVLDDLTDDKLDAFASTAYAIVADRAMRAHEHGRCGSSCSFCPLPAGEVAL